MQDTVEQHPADLQAFSNIKHITADGEDIQPSFDMFFQSTLSGKSSKLAKFCLFHLSIYFE
ncbi:hypothetical protein [Acinetobacter sp. BY484]|uniref:hypothetical protein n=1 Tax=unclassified Acinetobacter TaxID=196816 RepID=UPI00349F3F0B